jgi:hypothetical protein
MAEGKASGGGEGLSLQTLVVAAAASAVAAVVVSHVWRDGTVIAAAMTPVIVTIVKELLQRPMESELVRKPVSRIASGSRAALGSAVARGGVASGEEPPITERRTLAPPDGARGSANGMPDASPAAPIRTYGRARRRPPHLKIAVITGIVAFVIAAAALTLPELIFGGAVTSHHSTTLFGGGGGGSKSDKKKDEGNGTQSKPSDEPQQQTTTPSAPPSSSGGGTPTTTTPASPPPEQTAPEQTTPAPTTPVPTTPTPPSP